MFVQTILQIKYFSVRKTRIFYDQEVEGKPFGKEQAMENGVGSYRRFLGGDPDGLVEIIRDYKDGLMLYLNRYVQNIHIAEDLMEDTFVRIAVKKPRFSGKSSFKTWLYAIGRHIAVDFLRKSARLPAVSLEEVSPLSLQEEESVEQAYLKEERKITVHKALKRLNPDYGTVLYLLYFEEFSLSETAAILKKTYKQTDNLAYRAKLSLKSELEKEGFVYEEYE